MTESRASSHFKYGFGTSPGAASTSSSREKTCYECVGGSEDVREEQLDHRYETLAATRA